MKTQHVAPLTLGTVTSLAMLTLAVLTGCQSTNFVRSDATAGRLQATAAEIRVAISNLDATITALNDLLTNPSGDLRIQYDRFSLNLDRLALSSNRAFD